MYVAGMSADELLKNLLDCYEEIKRRARQRKPQMYASWKAGGFMVDNDIMYGNINDIVEALSYDDVDEEHDEHET